MSDSRAARIWRRTVVGFSLAGALALTIVIAARPWGSAFTTLAGAFIAIFAALEARRMGTLFDTRATLGTLTAILCAALVVLGGEEPTRAGLDHLGPAERYWVTTLAVFGVTALVVLCTALPAGDRLRARLLRGLWIAAPLPLLGLVRSTLGWEGLASLLVLSKIGDVAGYYGGQALGGAFPTHPFPRLSPGKTTVGCVCSLLTAGAAGGALVAVGWLPPGGLGVFSGVLAAALVNVAAQAGDLLESAAKREAQVKDSGTWFGPSGGVLDLADSLLLAVPIAVLAWPWLLDVTGS